MKTAAKTMLLGVCAATLCAVGGAQAQPVTAAAGPRATLYEYPNFQGRSITIYRSNTNLADSSFNDMAMSGHFDGDWTVCTDARFGGQCTRVTGDVTNLSQYGVGRSISSLQQGGPGGDRWNDDDQRGDNGRGDDRGYPGGRPGGDDRGYPGGRGDDDRGYPGGRPGGPGGPGGGPVVDPYPGAGGWGTPTQGRSVVFYPRPTSNGQDIAAYNRGAADWFCRRQGLGAAVYYDTSSRGRGFRWEGSGFAVNAPVLRDVLCRKF